VEQVVILMTRNFSQNSLNQTEFKYILSVNLSPSQQIFWVCVWKKGLLQCSMIIYLSIT